MKVAVEIVEELRYKLQMFNMLIDSAANVFCNNEAVYKTTVLSKSTLKKKHLSITYHRYREAMAAGTIRIIKQGTDKNLADYLRRY